MENAGIKAFIFSFSLSLSILIAVDKVLDCAQKKNENDLVITNKNIVLFINDTPAPHWHGENCNRPIDNSIRRGK